MSANVFFENIEYEITKRLGAARKSVKICVAWVNGEIYTPIFNDLAKRGIKVELIFDNNATNARYGVQPSSKFNLYPINTRLSSSLMHNKFCIIDDRIVINGSYNWSGKAKDSFENIVVIENDFKLVKKFLHEFYDLIDYYNAFSNNTLNKCSSGCGSYMYNLGILGSESGQHEESKIDIWSVCIKNKHAIHLGEEYDNHLHAHLGIKYETDFELNYYDRETMLNEFRDERTKLVNLEKHFDDRAGKKIHAIATVQMDNWNEHMEWGEDPEYVVKIFWRNMLFRKIIPDVLYDDGSGDINRIIRDHM